MQTNARSVSSEEEDTTRRLLQALSHLVHLEERRKMQRIRAAGLEFAVRSDCFAISSRSHDLWQIIFIGHSSSSRNSAKIQLLKF